MTVRTLDFDFRRVKSGAESDRVDGEQWIYNWHVGTSIEPVFDRLTVLNGINANTVVAKADNAGAGPYVLPLVIVPPSASLHPMVGPLGGGHVFGNGYKWRLRYKNSITGDVSGLSPVPPWAVNLGIETTPGADTYLGQTAYFRIACASSDLPSSGAVDTIQLFRSLSGAYDVWYLVQQKYIPAATSYLDFIDDFTDDELSASHETAGLSPNPSFAEGGVLPPLRKVHQHASGRAWYYGMRKMAPYRTGSVSVTVGSTTITRTSTATNFTIDRVGQSFRLKANSGGTTIDDLTVYRIVAVKTDGSTLTVTPDIQVSTQLVTGTYTSVTYEIVDDRDARSVYPSAPRRAGSFDLLESFAIGAGADEELLHIFAWRGVTYGQTNRALYRLFGDVSTDPSATLSIVRVGEGTTGFSSGCLTPFGWVYVNATRGVLLFTGDVPPLSGDAAGTVTPSVPLGSQDETQAFRPRDQFFGRDDDAYSSLTGLSTTGFDPDLLSECRVAFDPIEHFLHVFYVPTGHWSVLEEMIYDAEVRVWRGPWRRNCTASGLLPNADGTEQFVFGTDLGQLWIDARQDFDMIGTLPAAGTSGSSGSLYVLLDNATPFNATTYADQGVPIVATCATATRTKEYVRIIDVIGSGIAVLEFQAIEAGKTYTYQEGAIPWLFQTAWLDAGEPIQPKVAEKLRTRFERAASGASTATIGVLKDGDETLANITGESGTPFTLTPYSTTEPSYRDVRLPTGSRLFQIVGYGTSTTGDPKITEAVFDLRVDAGN